MKFVIEHLEPRLSRWCLLEYAHMSRAVGRQNLLFTHVRNPSAALKGLGAVFSRPAHEMDFQSPCVLDPEAPKELTPEDCKVFSHLIFGGILGDDPPRKRTREVFPGRPVARRHLGPAQMSTDTAVLVAKRVSDGTPLGKLPFQDGIEVEMGKDESVLLPYRYLLDRQGDPILPDGLVEFLKRRRSF